MRVPTKNEVEKIRLMLSTYQDGSGMLRQKDGTTLPGWRDFERTIAAVFDGYAQENKAIFDVLVPKAPKSTINFGISCKMRRELDQLAKTKRVYFELSNSSGYFSKRLRSMGIRDYQKNPSAVGKTLLALLHEWHEAVSAEHGGAIDLDSSFYLVLSWNRKGFYQLFQFPIQLPKAGSLKWYFPTRLCLRGDDRHGTLFEWYWDSGGQLKYYPLAKNAIWSSGLFKLEEIKDPKTEAFAKVSTYFPELWKQVLD